MLGWIMTRVTGLKLAAAVLLICVVRWSLDEAFSHVQFTHAVATVRGPSPFPPAPAPLRPALPCSWMAPPSTLQNTACTTRWPAYTPRWRSSWSTSLTRRWGAGGHKALGACGSGGRAHGRAL